MDGRARPAGEMAGIAGVTPQTAPHLRRLVEGAGRPAASRPPWLLPALRRAGVADALKRWRCSVAGAQGPLALPARRADRRAPATSISPAASASPCRHPGASWIHPALRRRPGAHQQGCRSSPPCASARVRWPAGKPCPTGPSAAPTWADCWARPHGASLRRGWLTRRDQTRAVRVTAAARVSRSTSRCVGPDHSGAVELDARNGPRTCARYVRARWPPHKP